MSDLALSMEEYLYIVRNDFATFIERSFSELNPQTRLIPGQYIDAIATQLEACRRGEVTRLIVSLPPRHLKSHCASIALPAWIFGHNRSAHIICVSYGQELADKFARDSRRLMTSPFYRSVFGNVLSTDRKAVHDFMTVKQGTRLATSVGGPLTGRGADYIIIDDPLKPDEAMSESQRKTVNEWYDNSLLSRLNDKAKGCIIIIMQRLHQDDLVAHVLEQGPWTVLSLPAIAEQNECHRIDSIFGKRLFRRRVGEALHPERESMETLALIRQTIGEYNFASQYQQNPSPPGGAMVKTEWLRFYEPGDQPATFDRVVQSWDTANKVTELSDFSVCTTWGLKNKYFYLLDVFRQRLNFPELKRAARDLGRSFAADTILIEDKASGTQLIQDLIADGVSSVTKYEPLGTDKVMRLHAQTATIENGFVLLPRSAPWLADYIRELTSFPGTRYDDQVDSTTQALAYLKAASITPTLWRRASLLVDGAPVPLPSFSTYAFAVLIVSEGGDAAVVYFVRNKHVGQPLLLADCELAPLSPEVFCTIVKRLSEICRIQNAYLFTTKPLAAEAHRHGYNTAGEIDVLLAEGENLALSAATHIAAGRVKITSKVLNKAQQLPLGGIIHGIASADDPLRAATLIGIALALDENRSLKAGAA